MDKCKNCNERIGCTIAEKYATVAGFTYIGSQVFMGSEFDPGTAVLQDAPCGKTT